MAKKSKIYFSNASWSEVGNSYDSHGSYEMAKGACLRLLINHANLPCKIRGYCKKVFVTDEEGNLHFERGARNEFIPSHMREKL